MENRKSLLEKLAPKKFCCRFTLKRGCKVVGLLLTLVMVACTTASVIQTADLQDCSGCPHKTWKQVYGYSVSTCVYYGLMCFINLWYIWGVKKGKKSIVLAWVVITAVWLAQTSCLLIVLILMYRKEVGHVAWIVSLSLSIFIIVVLTYFVFAGYGYYLQLRNRIRLSGTRIERA